MNGPLSQLRLSVIEDGVQRTMAIEAITCCGQQKSAIIVPLSNSKVSI